MCRALWTKLMDFSVPKHRLIVAGHAPQKGVKIISKLPLFAILLESPQNWDIFLVLINGFSTRD